MARTHPHGVRPPPSYDELVNTFLFRMALAAQVSILNWVHDGAQRKTKPEKVRNDLVDMVLATYATFFDGILTFDRQLLRTFGATTYFLKVIKANVAKVTR